MKKILTVIFLLSLITVSIAAEAPYHFAIIGDRTGSHVDSVYDEILGEINLLAPEFNLTVGDQIEGYTEDAAVLNQQWDEYFDIVHQLKAPLYLCVGNHDITYPSAEKIWQERTKVPPSYSLNWGAMHIIFLDTSRWESSQEWLDKSGYKDWLISDLAKHKNAKLTIVIYHKPFWYYTLAEGKPDPLHEIFKANGVDAVFNGHFHDYFTATYDGITYTAVGSSGGDFGTPDDEAGRFFHYLWCTVENNKLSWAIVRKGSVLPPNFVDVAYLKLADNAGKEIVKFDPITEGDLKGGKGTIVMHIDNTLGNAIATEVKWSKVANWEVTPETAALNVAPGAKADLSFAVVNKGGFFPLPEMALDLPFSEKKSLHYTMFLPALRSYVVPRLAKAPTLDGVVNKDEWGKTPPIDYFAAPDGSKTTVEPTQLYLGYDANSLYMAAVCAQKNMDKLVTTGAKRDDRVNKDDMVGMFLSPPTEKPEIYQVYVNAAGVLYDAYYRDESLGESPGEKWNSNITVAAGKGNGRPIQCHTGKRLQVEDELPAAGDGERRHR
jgi:predicted phosphodiesterase